MKRMSLWMFAWCVAAAAAAAAFAQAAPQPPETAAAPSEGDEAARRLLQRAKDLLQAGEKERAVKMLETVVEQHPASPVRYEAYLELGRYWLGQYQQAQALAQLARLRDLEQAGPDLKPDLREVYLEGTYLTGVAYFQMKQYSAAFPVLRKITNNYPNTVWANQAYYYVGMCHFAQGNWQQAIRDLSLVGTFVEDLGPTSQYVEAGRRFYVKVRDADLPVLERLGREIAVTAETASGDRETLSCLPLAGRQGLFIASIATEIAPPKPGDHTLQVVGGDTITVKYYDDNTREGRKDVLRDKQVKVVSTGSVALTVGTYESPAPAAFLKQPLAVLLEDADLDKGDAADTAEVRVVSRYKEETAGGSVGIGLEKLRQEAEAEPYKVRDEVVVTLTELGAGPVRSGRFGGSVLIDTYREDQPVSKTDDRLACAIGDEVVAIYIDERHIGGEAPREAAAKVLVAGEIDARPQPTQNVVPDPILRAKKNLVEATAYLELARIFKSMGLLAGAKEKAKEGLERVDPVIRIESPIPSALKEEAFKLKWELFIVQEDFASAILTCQLFHRLYPDSPFVDQALVGIGRIRFESKEYPEAVQVFQQVLRLEQSQAKAEAQYMIAQCLEAQARAAHLDQGLPESQFVIPEAAIQQYKLCADRYPDSAFAGESLAKLVKYQIDSRDYTQAADLLERIFEDYPDADFLDQMLRNWVLVAYRMGDLQKAHDKCVQLVTEYPSSQYAKEARELLDKIKGAMEEKATP